MTRSPGSCPHGPLGGFLFFVCVCVRGTNRRRHDKRQRGKQAGRLSQDRVGKCEQGCNWSSSDLCQVTSESLARSLARARVHRRFVPHPSVCFLHVVFSLFSQQPMMSLQLCSSSPRNPEAFRRLFRRVLTDVCSEVCSIVDSRFSFFLSCFTAASPAPMVGGWGWRGVGWGRGYTMDRLPVHRRAAQKDTRSHT